LLALRAVWRYLLAMQAKRHRRQGGSADAHMWHIGLALFVGGAAADFGLVGLSWLAWSILHRPRIARSGAISLHDAVSVLQLVFASVAGAGALVALIVAYRKQKVAEADSSHDRTRVFNERFTAIATELGDSEPAVRLAGVHAMAGLADDWAANRQTCVDVLCAFLRMPYRPPIMGSAPELMSQALRAAREVRETVIRVITAHLRLSAAVSWQGLDFDFTGAVFEGGDFGRAIFNGGKVSFRDAIFAGGTLDFGGAIFSGGQVDFSGAEFTDGKVGFGSAEFQGGGVSFAGAKFSGGFVDFNGAVFSGSRVGFIESYFSGGKINFEGAVFGGGRVFFNRVAFSGSEVGFRDVMFVGSSVEFMGAKFSGGHIDFDNALFSSGQTEFSYAKFSGSLVSFSFANFSSKLFSPIYRAGNTVDYGTTFLSRLNSWIARSRVNSWVAFLTGGAELKQLSSGILVNFFGAEFSGGSVLFDSAEFSGGEVGFTDAKFLGGQVDFSQVRNWSVPPLRFETGTQLPGVKLPGEAQPAN
jgi:uncharacterized protein YjbI with pentapeptide repeats